MKVHPSEQRCIFGLERHPDTHLKLCRIDAEGQSFWFITMVHRESGVLAAILVASLQSSWSKWSIGVASYDPFHRLLVYVRAGTERSPPRLDDP